MNCSRKRMALIIAFTGMLLPSQAFSDSFVDRLQAKYESLNKGTFIKVITAVVGVAGVTYFLLGKKSAPQSPGDKKPSSKSATNKKEQSGKKKLKARLAKVNKLIDKLLKNGRTTFNESVFKQIIDKKDINLLAMVLKGDTIPAGLGDEGDGGSAEKTVAQSDAVGVHEMLRDPSVQTTLESFLEAREFDFLENIEVDQTGVAIPAQEDDRAVINDEAADGEEDQSGVHWTDAEQKIRREHQALVDSVWDISEGPADGGEPVYDMGDGSLEQLNLLAKDLFLNVVMNFNMRAGIEEALNRASKGDYAHLTALFKMLASGDKREDIARVRVLPVPGEPGGWGYLLNNAGDSDFEYCDFLNLDNQKILKKMLDQAGDELLRPLSWLKLGHLREVRVPRLVAPKKRMQRAHKMIGAAFREKGFNPHWQGIMRRIMEDARQGDTEPMTRLLTEIATYLTVDGVELSRVKGQLAAYTSKTKVGAFTYEEFENQYLDVLNKVCTSKQFSWLANEKYRCVDGIVLDRAQLMCKKEQQTSLAAPSRAAAAPRHPLAGPAGANKEKKEAQAGPAKPVAPVIPPAVLAVRHNRALSLVGNFLEKKSNHGGWQCFIQKLMDGGAGNSYEISALIKDIHEDKGSYVLEGHVSRREAMGPFHATPVQGFGAEQFRSRYGAVLSKLVEEPRFAFLDEQPK